MDLTVNFYIQAGLCVLTFAVIFMLMHSTQKLNNQLENKTDKD